ncbi:DUF58 domain-containing protein [Lachnospiraceae bacterium 29-84]
MRNFICFLAMAGGFLYLAVLYNSAIFLAFSVAVFVAAPLFLAMLSKVRDGLECQLVFPAYPQESAGNYEIYLDVENKGRFYAPCLRAKVNVFQKQTGKAYRVKVQGAAGAGKPVRLTGTIEKPEFGLWQAECSSLLLFDWLGIFCVKKKLTASQQSILYPACYETNVNVGVRTRLFWSGGDSYHPQISGDDPSEMLKFRDYQNGDRMNQIHWKLSAKNDSLIVAEMSLPIGCNVVCFLDAQIGQMDIKKRRAYWEVLHTVSQGLLQQGCFHYLVWYCKKRQELCRKAIRSPEDLSEFWGEIWKYQMGCCAFAQEYQQSFQGEGYASSICWNQDLELSCNNKFLFQAIPGQVKEQLLELEVTV